MKYGLIMLAIFGFSLAQEGCSKVSNPNDGAISSPSPQKMMTTPSSPTDPVGDKKREVSLFSPPDPSSSTLLENSDKQKQNFPSNRSGSNSPKPTPSFGDAKTGRDEPIATYPYVNATDGLLVHDSPAGKIIGELDNGQRVSLTGATEDAAGSNWSQLTSGGWVDSQYIGFK